MWLISNYPNFLRVRLRGSGEYGQEDGIAGARDGHAFGLHRHLAFRPTLTAPFFPILRMVSPRFTGCARRPLRCCSDRQSRGCWRIGLTYSRHYRPITDRLCRYFQYSGPLPLCYPLYGSTSGVGSGQSRQLFDCGTGCLHPFYRVNVARHRCIGLLAFALCGYWRVAPDLARLAPGQYRGRCAACHHLWCG